MPTLCIALLGTYVVTHDGRPVTAFAYDKVRGLLAYLAVEADRPTAATTWRRCFGRSRIAVARSAIAEPGALPVALGPSRRSSRSTDSARHPTDDPVQPGL